MTMLRKIACVILLCGATLYAQTSAPLRFEVAAIKPTPPDQWKAVSGGKTGKGRLSMQNRTLKRYIMGAYGIGPKSNRRRTVVAGGVSLRHRGEGRAAGR